jgi:hypothetical protein
MLKKKFVTKLKNMGLVSGIREKTYSGSRIRVQKSKRHRIPDPDPKHYVFYLRQRSRCMLRKRSGTRELQAGQAARANRSCRSTLLAANKTRHIKSMSIFSITIIYTIFSSAMVREITVCFWGKI